VFLEFYRSWGVAGISEWWEQTAAAAKFARQDLPLPGISCRSGAFERIEKRVESKEPAGIRRLL